MTNELFTVSTKLNLTFFSRSNVLDTSSYIFRQFARKHLFDTIYTVLFLRNKLVFKHIAGFTTNESADCSSLYDVSHWFKPFDRSAGEHGQSQYLGQAYSIGLIAIKRGPNS